MSVQTEIEGSPDPIEGAADWLRTSLAPAVETGATAMNDARRSADASWHDRR